MEIVFLRVRKNRTLFGDGIFMPLDLNKNSCRMWLPDLATVLQKCLSLEKVKLCSSNKKTDNCFDFSIILLNFANGF